MGAETGDVERDRDWLSSFPTSSPSGMSPDIVVSSLRGVVGDAAVVVCSVASSYSV